MASSWMENPTDKDGLLLKRQWLDCCFRCEDNNVAFTNVQLYIEYPNKMDLLVGPQQRKRNSPRVSHKTNVFLRTNTNTILPYKSGDYFNRMVDRWYKRDK